MASIGVAAPLSAPGTAAHPVDTERLHRYWVAGPGLAKWQPMPKPWTALYHHLAKYMNPDEAKRTATNWFIEVFHFAPGSDLNRVTHGHPPRGKLIGPG